MEATTVAQAEEAGEEGAARQAGAGKKGESSLVIGSERPRCFLPRPHPRPLRHRLFTGFFRHHCGGHKALFPRPARPTERGREGRCTRNGITKFDDRKMQLSGDLCRVARDLSCGVLALVQLLSCIIGIWDSEER